MKRVLDLLAILLLCAVSSQSARATNLIGAGATFPYPLYSKWFNVYKNARINYQAIGSGGGINQIKARTVDFGASDAPLSDEELAAMTSPIVQMPMTAGAVAIAYNLPGVKGLRLSGQVLADLYLGKITRWNHPRLQVLNVGVALPNRPITVLRRSDGSGTTWIFTNYLSSVSEEWRKKIGTGRNVAWPVGLGGRSGRSGDGLHNVLRSQTGSIVYAELAYVMQQNLPYAQIRNRDGQWVFPTIEGVSAAVSNSQAVLKRDIRAPIVDALGAQSYPISGLSYVLFYRHQADAQKGKALFDFLRWGNDKGQTYARSLAYAPLPTSLRLDNNCKLDFLQRGLQARAPISASRTR